MDDFASVVDQPIGYTIRYVNKRYITRPPNPDPAVKAAKPKHRSNRSLPINHAP